MTVETRVCYVTPEYPSVDRPDAGRPIYEVCRRIEVPSLIQAKCPDGQPLAPPPHARLQTVVFPDTLLASRDGWRRRSALVAKGSGYGVFFLKSLRQLTAFRPTLIHLETPMPILHGLFAQGAFRARLSISLIGTDMVWVARSRALQALVRRADVLLPVSDHMVPALREIAPRARIVTAPMSIDFDTFRPVGLERRAQFLVPAALRWEKAHDVLLDGFARLLGRHAQARLILAGAGPLESAIRARTSALGLDHAVTLVGHVSPDLLARLMNESLVCVLSSRSEGAPRVLSEAIACGTPVIATRVGACEAMVRDVGLSVPAEDPDALAEAMSAFLDRPAFWDACARACPRRTAEFGLDPRAKLYSEAFTG